MSDWGQASEDLFRNARRGLSPTAADRDRVRARIAARIGTGAAVVGAILTTASNAGAGVTAGSAALGTGKGITAALVAKIIVPVLLVGATVAATPRVAQYVRDMRDTSASQNVVPGAPVRGATVRGQTTSLPTANLPSPSEPVAPPSLPTFSVDALPSAPVPTPSTVRSPVASPAPATRARNAAALPSPITDVAAAEEARLVSDIDAALRGGSASRALALADEHARRFPRGLLVEEREGARVMARCMTGTPEASGVDAFLAAHPRSPMRARLKAACGSREN